MGSSMRSAEGRKPILAAVVMGIRCQDGGEQGERGAWKGKAWNGRPGSPLGTAHTVTPGRSHNSLESVSAPSFFPDVGPQFPHLEWQCRPHSVGRCGVWHGVCVGGGEVLRKEYSGSEQGCSGDQGGLERKGPDGVTAGR